MVVELDFPFDLRHFFKYWYGIYTIFGICIQFFEHQYQCSTPSFHFIRLFIHGTATCRHRISSLPPPPLLNETHDAMDFSTSGVTAPRNSVWHCTRRCCRYGETWSGHDRTVIYYYYFMSSLKLLQIKDFLHYVFLIKIFFIIFCNSTLGKGYDAWDDLMGAQVTATRRGVKWWLGWSR